MLEHYPEWAKELGKKYLSRTINQFILHGNVQDLTAVERDDHIDFMRIKTFLSEEFFGARDFVIFYDRSGGIYFRDKASQVDFNRAVAGQDSLAGTEYAKKMPKDPVRVFSLLEKYFNSRIEQNKSLAIIIDYAETILPANEVGNTAAEDRNSLVYLLKWAHNQLYLAADFTTVLLTENLADLNRNLVQNPYTSEIRVPLPNQYLRKKYIQQHFEDQPKSKNKQGGEERGKKKSNKSSNPPNYTVLAQQTAGLNFVNLEGILARTEPESATITQEKLIQQKKELIEAEAYGLLEFVETGYTLDDVAGHVQVKEHLREAISALKQGRKDVLPMGYLVCGPVGTGKTFLVTCFSGEVGIPMVKLKNFRSQWQGVTEGNLEKILALLKAMAPVAVMIDEADAYLGDRASSGDSGVSSRVFSQIATFMSDTANRGNIIWFLMTARPDLMPVDLKRQGRAEEHLALFPPSTKDERIELFEAMKKKTGLRMTKNIIPEVIENGHKVFSGADMEAALTRAKFRAASEGKKRISPKLLKEALEDFLPPAYPDQIELQTLSAVLECTSKRLLPEKYRSLDREQLITTIEELKRNRR